MDDTGHAPADGLKALAGQVQPDPLRSIRAGLPSVDRGKTPLASNAVSGYSLEDGGQDTPSDLSL